MHEGNERDTGTEKLRLFVEGGVARLVFDNQARHNALSFGMLTALPGALGAVEADPDVRVLVVHGAGQKAFVSGADISEFGERRTSPEARAEYDAAAAAASVAWASVGKPVIAAVRGFCMGAGVLAALQADIRIAGDDAVFAVPAARLGLGYGFGGVEALMAVVGPAWTAEILFSARRVSAAEALGCGLVNRVVPAGAVLDEALALAGFIRDNAPLTVAACKAALREARKAPGARDLDRVRAMVEACFRSQDYLEGQAAFAEKRAPRFTGR